MALKAGLYVLGKSSAQQNQILRSIISIQASCILNDHTMATFIPPLSFDRMIDRWTTFFHDATEGRRVILVWLCEISSRSNTHNDVNVESPFDGTWPRLSDDLEVGGTISLSLPASETGPFRGTVQNLFVHPLHRRKGIASKLLAELERQAFEHGRWSLMLDTTVGTPAETMYETLGWNRLGVVKDYGYKPSGIPAETRLADEVWFWKDLRSSKLE